ncbi:MAG: hypothetical protein IH607_02455 [Firmicutes bacterium]|nr:hypothetical protein [Bacillota bacterium]
MKKQKALAILAILCAMALALSSCASKGSVTIVEKTPNRAFDITMKAWTLQDTVTLNLNAGDELHVDIQCETGDVAMDIAGQNGSTPYSGKALADMTFTVTVEETDTYTVTLKGNQATGTVTLAP